MSSELLSPSRRSFLATAAAMSAGSLLPAKLMAAFTTETVNTMNRGSSHDHAIRPCRIDVLKAAIVDPRRVFSASSPMADNAVDSMIASATRHVDRKA